MRGHLAHFVSYAKRVEEEKDAMLRSTATGSMATGRGGGMFRSMKERNDEARALRDGESDACVFKGERKSIHDVRVELNALWRRCQATYEDRTKDDDYAQMALEVEAMRHRLGRLRDILNRAMKDKTPKSRARPAKKQPSTRKVWTKASATKALKAYYREHERLPRAREFGSKHGLPSYEWTRRTLGKLEDLDRRFERETPAKKRAVR